MTYLFHSFYAKIHKLIKSILNIVLIISIHSIVKKKWPMVRLSFVGSNQEQVSHSPEQNDIQLSSGLSVLTIDCGIATCGTLR